ncbi:MAG: SBBP repeat-containing protein [Kofleriaceae bacterium]
MRRWVLLALFAGCGRVDFDRVPETACPEGGCVVTTAWSLAAGSTAVDFGFALALDEARQRVYVTGLYAGSTVDYGAGPLTGMGFHDIPLVALELDGAVAWSTGVGGAGFDEGFGVAVAADGSIEVAGRAGSPITIGGVDLGAGAFADVVSYRVERDGSVRPGSARLVGGPGDDFGRVVALDDDGNVYVAGHFTDTVDLGQGPVTAADAESSDAFIVSYAPGGAVRWVQAFGGVGLDEIEGLGVDDARGQLVASGSLSGTIDLGLGPLASAGDDDALVLAVDLATGAPRWQLAFGGGDHDGANGLALGADGEAYVTGYFTGTVEVAGEVFVADGDQDVLLVRVDADGSPRWGRRFGGPGRDRAIRIATGARGEVVAVGTFTDTAGWADARLSSAGADDGFAIALDGDGTPRWARGFGGPGIDELQAVAIDADGSLYITGAFEQTVDVGAGPHTSAGDLDTLIFRLDVRYASLTARAAHGPSRRWQSTTRGSAVTSAAPKMARARASSSMASDTWAWATRQRSWRSNTSVTR